MHTYNSSSIRQVAINIIITCLIIFFPLSAHSEYKGYRNFEEYMSAKYATPYLSITPSSMSSYGRYNFMRVNKSGTVVYESAVVYDNKNKLIITFNSDDMNSKAKRIDIELFTNQDLIYNPDALDKWLRRFLFSPNKQNFNSVPPSPGNKVDSNLYLSFTYVAALDISNILFNNDSGYLDSLFKTRTSLYKPGVFIMFEKWVKPIPHIRDGYVRLVFSPINRL